MATRFIGLWKLIPESCKDDMGQATVRANYYFTLLPENINLLHQRHRSSNQLNRHQLERQLSLLKDPPTRQQDEHSGVKIQTLHEITTENIMKSTIYRRLWICDNGGLPWVSQQRQAVVSQDDNPQTPKGPINIFQFYSRKNGRPGILWFVVVVLPLLLCLCFFVSLLLSWCLVF